MHTSNYLAMDYGASTGRGILGKFDGNQLLLEEIFRFDNYFVNICGLYYWDAFMLYHKMVEGLSLTRCKLDKSPLKSIGIDTWGTDYGLLDGNGQLIGNVRCMRNADGRYAEQVLAKIKSEDLYKRTGIQTIYGNTLFQLFERVTRADAALQQAETLLMLPDLLSYFLTGEKFNEFTIASTSMLYNPKDGDWDRDLCELFEIPNDIFCDIIQPASIKFPLLADLQTESGLKSDLVPVASHDTASAVAAAQIGSDAVFCSSGTWSLIGVETTRPIISKAAHLANFSNEGTVDGGFRFLKNIMGMWMIQECKKEWDITEGRLTWDDIVCAAEEAPAFRSLIDPENHMFYQSGNMVKKITDFCAHTNQPVPQTIGEIARCVYESIALRYKMAFDQIESITGKQYSSLCIVGGGSRNKLLNQMAANALQKPVYAGPVEAACIGNLLTQAVAASEIKYDQIRDVVKTSFDRKEFLPESCATQWEYELDRLKRIISIDFSYS